MSAGRCPHCKSSFYTPDPSPGGAGRNKCMECGKASPVAAFYPIEPDRELHTKATTLADRLHTETPPAPIRQYKDD